MIRWLWKSGKRRESEGALSRRLDDLESRQKRLEEGEAARELTLAHTLGQLQRLAGRISKTAGIDAAPPKSATDGFPTTADDVFRIAREKGLSR